ncbi:MAG: hypothetical protein R8G66_03825 [Cytophagales bacterium]|nr:hypothetical protein [Cytophagales bacterium]
MYKSILVLVILQVLLFIAGGITFGVYKEEIHHGLESAMGENLFRGDSMHIGTLDYASTLMLAPQLELEEVKIWGLGAKHLTPAFDLGKIEITLSWHEILTMLWDASEWSRTRPFVNIKNERVRVKLKGMKIIDGTLTMTRTSEGHNHRLFRPPMEKILQFASGELKMAGGFRIRKFEAENFHLDYYKDRSSNPQEALPKRYDVQFDYMSMDMSSDPERAYFNDFYAEGTINSIRVKDNEGLVGRTFKADGDAELIKLSIPQKLNNDTGFDLVSDNFNVTFNDLTATTRGILSTLNERMRMDIDFQSKTGTGTRKNEALLSFLELTLSDRFLDIIRSYDPLGELTFVGKVYNKDNAYGGPIKIDLDYDASATSFQFRFFENGKSHRISDLELSGEFEVGGDSPSYITADITNGELYPGQPFQGRIVLDNVFRREFMDSIQQLAQPPLAEVQFESNHVDFKRLLEFLEFDAYDQAEGFIDFRDFHFSGPIASLSKSYSDLNYGGELRFDNLTFDKSIPKLPFPLHVEETNGGIVFAKNSVKPKMAFTFNQHPIAIKSGIIRDFVPYIFNEDRDRLTLENFSIEVDSVEIKTLLEELAELSADKNDSLLVDFEQIKSGYQTVVNNLKIKDLEITIPQVDVSELYQIKDVAGIFPMVGPIQMINKINIDDGISLEVTNQIGSDSIQVSQRIQMLNERLVAETELNLAIADINDFGCQIGIEVPLGGHLSEPLSLEGQWQVTNSWGPNEIETYLSGSGSRIFNEALDIDLQIQQFEADLRLEDYQLTPPVELSIGIQLDEQVVGLNVQVKNDSIFIETPAPQSLEFAVAKKYLSLICEIDQNLERLQNLEGVMTFNTYLKEPLHQVGLSMITEANQVGTFGLQDLSFDFIKGSDVIGFQNIDGRFRYDAEAVYIDQFRGNYEDSDFEIYNTQLEDIIGFILLGDPLVIDSLHLRSNLLDLTSILESGDAYSFPCEVEEANVPIEPQAICEGCLVRTQTHDTFPEAEPIAFSLLNFLQTSEVKYADAYLERILFRPISGSAPFEIDNLSTSVKLDSSRLTLLDLQARMYDGLIFQYQPLNVWVKNLDTIAVQGAYTVKDLELHEVIENLNNPSVDVLKSDQLDFKGKLSMDFDFIDTLTQATDLNNLEFRINNMQIVEGSALELNRIGMDKKWKENVGPFKRMVAGLFLGSFKKKFERPTQYVMNLENLVLDTGWVQFDVMEFYNNQFNLVASGNYHIENGHRDVDLLLQRSEKNYQYDKFLSTYCDNGFLTYFNVTEDAEKIEFISPSTEEQNARDQAFQDCLEACPCSEEDCVNTCLEQFPTLNKHREVPNKIQFRIGNKRIKERCD